MISKFNRHILLRVEQDSVKFNLFYYLNWRLMVESNKDKTMKSYIYFRMPFQDKTTSNAYAIYACPTDLNSSSAQFVFC